MLDVVDGLEILSYITKSAAPSVVILMTGFGSMEGAIKAIQDGAFDYVSKPFKINELKAVVARAVRHYEASQQPSQVASAKNSAPFAPKTLIGKSPQIVEVYKTLARATMSPSNVLIIGESGTGKELVARGIHEHSPRREKKFVAVNCGALTESLLESELFGHVKGAFTGAIATKAGLFEEANGGTIFLDEIGDISAALQVKLLRVIQEGEYKPVGLNETKKSRCASYRCHPPRHLAPGLCRRRKIPRRPLLSAQGHFDSSPAIAGTERRSPRSHQSLFGPIRGKNWKECLPCLGGGDGAPHLLPVAGDGPGAGKRGRARAVTMTRTTVRIYPEKICRQR